MPALQKSLLPVPYRASDHWLCLDNSLGCSGEHCSFFMCSCKRKCPQRPKGYTKQPAVCGVKENNIGESEDGK